MYGLDQRRRQNKPLIKIHRLKSNWAQKKSFKKLA